MEEQKRSSEVLQSSARVQQGFCLFCKGSTGSQKSAVRLAEVLQSTVRFSDAHTHSVEFPKVLRDVERKIQVLQSSKKKHQNVLKGFDRLVKVI